MGQRDRVRRGLTATHDLSYSYQMSLRNNGQTLEVIKAITSDDITAAMNILYTVRCSRYSKHVHDMCGLLV